MTWDEWDYQLALAYRLWRAMPAPPSAKKEPGLFKLYERFMQAAVRDKANALHALQPKEPRTKPFPNDPEDVLK